MSTALLCSGSESPPSSGAGEFVGGQTVQWKLRGRIHTGQLVTTLTEPTQIEGHFVSASNKEPKWLGQERMHTDRDEGKRKDTENGCEGGCHCSSAFLRRLHSSLIPSLPDRCALCLFS